MEKENVKSAPAKMKNGKVFESSGTVTKIFFASGDVGLERIASLFKCTLKKYLVIGTQASLYTLFQAYR